MINVTVESSDPTKAAVMANNYAQAYVDYRKRLKIDSLFTTGEELQKRVSDLAQENATSTPGSRRSGAVPNDQTDAEVFVPGHPAPMPTWRRRTALSRTPFRRSRSPATWRAAQARITENATAPTSPIKPQPMRNAMVAVVVGLLVGVGLAFLVEYLERLDRDEGGAGAGRSSRCP